MKHSARFINETMYTFYLNKEKANDCATVAGIVVLQLLLLYLTLTDPLRIQPWLQDRRNQTKSNRKHIPKKKKGKQTEGNEQESSQQRTSSPGRDTEETHNKNKETRNKKHKQETTTSYA